MTQVRLQQTAADSLAERDRSGIQQQHYDALPTGDSLADRSVAPGGTKCCIMRVLTSTGVMAGRGKSAGVPGLIRSRANVGPSVGGLSSHLAIAPSASVSKITR